jgi:hypothetical protein
VSVVLLDDVLLDCVLLNSVLLDGVLLRLWVSRQYEWKRRRVDISNQMK